MFLTGSKGSRSLRNIVRYHLPNPDLDRARALCSYVRSHPPHNLHHNHNHVIERPRLALNSLSAYAQHFSQPNETHRQGHRTTDCGGGEGVYRRRRRQQIQPTDVEAAPFRAVN